MSIKTVIFDQVDPFPTKTNFVDSNNVLVGYDRDEQCCEDHYWEIFTKLEDGRRAILYSDEEDCMCGQTLVLPGYTFDIYYFDEYAAERDNPTEHYAEFKLVNNDTNKPDLYLRLCNQHEGYYSHGFVISTPERKGEI